MKRLFALILAVSMLLSMASVGFADEHVHGNDGNKPASTPGYHFQWCDGCQSIYGNANPCEDRDEDGYCDWCNAEMPAPAHDHDFEFVSTDVNGKKVHGNRCDCGEWENGYTECTFSGNWVMKNGKTNDGEGYKVCDNKDCSNKLQHECKDFEWREDISNPGTQHSQYCTVCSKWKNKSNEDHTPDCTGVCTVCGKEGLTPTGHKGFGTEGSECVATEDGHYYTCAVCGKQAGNVWKHSDWQGSINGEGEFVVNGEVKAILKSSSTKHWLECCECGTIFGEAAHTAGNWEKVDANTHARKCTECGQVLETKAHDFGSEVTCGAVPYCATCGYTGTYTEHDLEYKYNEDEHWQECKNCDYKSTAAAHDFSTGCDTEPDPVNKYVICECGYAKVDHKHILVTVPAKAPTCTEDGNVAYTKCTTTECTYQSVEDPSIPKAHTMSYKVLIEGGCTTPSYYEISCSKCKDESVNKKTYGYFSADGKFNVCTKDADVGEHSWDDGVKTAADCCNNSYTTYSCTKCDAKEVVVNANTALGHKPVYATKWVAKEGASKDGACIMQKVQYVTCARCKFDSTKNATCVNAKTDVETGVANCKCNVYDDNEILDTVTNDKHSFTKKIVKGDCTNTDAVMMVCSVCGYEYEETASTPITGGEHLEINSCTFVGKRATCTEKGSYYYLCKCGAHLDEDGKVITSEDGVVTEEAKGHDFEAKHTDATCSDFGFTTYTCKSEGCGRVVVVTHDGVKKTEETDEYLTDANYDTIEAPSITGHKWEKGAFLTGSQECGKTGWYEKVCSICGEKDADNRYYYRNEHEWVLDGDPDVAPSCKGLNQDNSGTATAGKGKIKCSKCGETDYCTDLATLLGLELKHNLVKKTFAATCEEAAKYGYYCTICGAEFKGEVVDAEAYPALGHNMKTRKYTSCITGAAEIEYCTRCDDKTKIEKLAEGSSMHLGKIEKIWKDSKQTCTTGGSYAYVCTACNAYLKSDTDAERDQFSNLSVEPYWYDVDKLGHDYKKAPVVVAANCVEDGYTTQYCERCEKDIVVATTKKLTGTALDNKVGTGHKAWTIVEWVIKGNCNEDGYAIYGCPFCGQKDTEGKKLVPAGHIFPTDAEVEADSTLIKNVLKAPTCGTEGLGTTVCSRCGAIGSDLYTIPATGKHTFGTKVVKSTSCDKADATYYFCLDCEALDKDYKGYLDTSLYDVDTYGKGVIKLGATGEHEFTSTVKLAATCENNGGTFKVCGKCGYIDYKNPVQLTAFALGHKEKTETTKEATCYEDGLKVTYCLRCGEILNKVAIEKTAHNLVIDKDRSVASTCISKGYNVWVCDNDGCDYELTKALDALDLSNHVYEVIETYAEADCKTKQNGIVKLQCKYHKDAVAIDLTSWTEVHDWAEGEVILPATCTKSGDIAITCTKCGAEGKKGIAAAGHQWATRDVEATCEAGAYTETYCTVCGKVDAATVETGLALGHKWLAKTYVEPTCEKDGYWSTKCERCGKETAETDLNNPAKALGHDYKVFVKSVPATCQEVSYDLYKCVRCDAVEKQNKGTAKGDHDFQPVDETIKVPACNEEGIYVYSECTVCHAKATKKLTGAHKWVGPLVATNGDKVTAIYYVCSVCGKIDSDRLTTVNGFDGFGGCMTNDGTKWTGAHTLAGGIVTDATCTENGKITVLYCTKCKTVIAEEVELEAKGHTVVEVAEVPATCTEDGTSAYSYCSVCNEELTKKEVLPAGHKLVEVEAAVEATCTEDGKTASKKCENCDYVEESKVVPATGHKVVDIPAVDPTESSAGSTAGKKCETCGEILEQPDVIPAKEAKLIVPAILRAAGYDKAATLTRLYTGTEIKIIESVNENGYYKVEVAGQTGYMHKSYIEIL